MFDKVGNVKQADIVSTKRLGTLLASGKKQQKKIGSSAARGTHPGIG